LWQSPHKTNTVGQRRIGAKTNVVKFELLLTRSAVFATILGTQQRGVANCRTELFADIVSVAYQ
jgi:hypothetical protein